MVGNAAVVGVGARRSVERDRPLRAGGVRRRPWARPLFDGWPFQLRSTIAPRCCETVTTTVRSRPAALRRAAALAVEQLGIAPSTTALSGVASAGVGGGRDNCSAGGALPAASTWPSFVGCGRPSVGCAGRVPVGRPAGAAPASSRRGRQAPPGCKTPTTLCGPTRPPRRAASVVAVALQDLPHQDEVFVLTSDPDDMVRVTSPKSITAVRI